MWSLLSFGCWIFFNFYKLFLSLFANTLNFLERIRFFEGLLFFTNSWSLGKLMSIKSVMPSNHFILCCPLLLLSSLFPSNRVFSNESVLHIYCPKYWRFNFSISPSNEYSGLISFRIDWLGLLAVQGTLKSLVQHHSSKPSILHCLPFFMAQRSNLYMITGKIIALIILNFFQQSNVAAFRKFV